MEHLEPRLLLKSPLGAGDWHDAANWNPAGVPGLLDDVTVAGEYTLDFDQSGGAQTLIAESPLGQSSVTVLDIGPHELALSENLRVRNITPNGATTSKLVTTGRMDILDTIYIGEGHTQSNNFANAHWYIEAGYVSAGKNITVGGGTGARLEIGPGATLDVATHGVSVITGGLNGNSPAVLRVGEMDNIEGTNASLFSPAVGLHLSGRLDVETGGYVSAGSVFISNDPADAHDPVISVRGSDSTQAGLAVLSATGTISLHDGTLELGEYGVIQSADIDGFARIEASGGARIDSNITSRDVLIIGLPHVDLNGNLDNQGALHFELQDAVTSSRISIDGAVTLAGDFSLSCLACDLSGAVAGTSWNLITATSISGSFATETFPVPPVGLTWELIVSQYSVDAMLVDDGITLADIGSGYALDGSSFYNYDGGGGQFIVDVWTPANNWEQISFDMDENGQLVGQFTVFSGIAVDYTIELSVDDVDDDGIVDVVFADLADSVGNLIWDGLEFDLS